MCDSHGTPKLKPYCITDQVDNLWFKGDFNRSNDYVALTIGNTYKVKGYGYRIGLLNAYQKIYAFEEV